jgi:GTP diphosphokinase / guanosine-3',5'-bis(diphosphate) 3'-diphosphatase
MELRRRERRLAGEKPLLDLATELGYPNLEAMCVAIADHAAAADEIADKLIEQVDGAALKAAAMAARSRRTA